jgi:hypothetical protein
MTLKGCNSTGSIAIKIIIIKLIEFSERRCELKVSELHERSILNFNFEL